MSKIENGSRKIAEIHSLEILDSRGTPTIQTVVVLDDGSRGTASVPSGASTGKYEALELRDGDENRFFGKGVLKAIENVDKKIMEEVRGFDAEDQKGLDAKMLELDGTDNKANLGANAILSVSLAASRAVARSKVIPYYEHLRDLFGTEGDHVLPMPLFNFFNGGQHADSGLNVQEFKAVPVSASNMAEAVRMGAEVFHALKEILSDQGLSTAVGDEGGFAPNITDHDAALRMLVQGFEKAGYKPEEDFAIALDVAASEFFEDGKYQFDPESVLTGDGLLDIYEEWIEKYPIVSIEDGLDQLDKEGWLEMTERLGGRIQIIGDDFFVTDPRRVEEGIREKQANAVLVKVNQIGSLSETFETIGMAQEAGFGVIISHRSGETCDTSIADLAVATNAGQIKTGSLSRSERNAKYNRLMQIEAELGDKAKFSQKFKK